MREKLIPLTLEQHQQILYEILYMVDDFCKAHDIPYFLVGGSLLGAVRHQGIIPWDDDVDIAMTRENYDRFIEEFRADPTIGYGIFDFEHDKHCYFPFVKVFKCGTYNVEEGIPCKNQSCKISIDLFVYDGCYDDLEQSQEYMLSLRQKIRKYYGALCTKFNSRNYSVFNAKVYYLIKTLPFVVIPHYLHRKQFLGKLYRKLQARSVHENKYSACIAWGVYGKGEVQPSESFLNLTTMQFGERQLPVPSGWHEYLKGIYGTDYMTPLPIEKRHRHTDASFMI